MAKEQSYKSHRRYYPPLHFFVTPVLLINVAVVSMQWDNTRQGLSAWNIAVALALAALPFIARLMALKAQDRVIRLEERLRLASLAPDIQPRLNDLRPGHLVALRFASDEEAPDLARRCLNGEFKSSGEVKRAIKSWRGDYLRV
ncbi:MAG TPA: DUF6526 family protein [Gemmatimonadaceae bacterium]|nr:DUF6526 family protein [Gemmatimonadaceae bacterium]